jgi:hypothetical protein
MSGPVQKFGPRQRIGGLLLLSGGLCGVGAALLLTSDGMRRVVGVDRPGETPWIPMLALLGLGTVLILSGKKLIGGPDGSG